MILFCINGEARRGEPRRAAERCRSRTGRAARGPARRGSTAGLRGEPRLLLPVPPRPSGARRPNGVAGVGGRRLDRLRGWLRRRAESGARRGGRSQTPAAAEGWGTAEAGTQLRGRLLRTHTHTHTRAPGAGPAASRAPASAFFLPPSICSGARVEFGGRLGEWGGFRGLGSFFLVLIVLATSASLGPGPGTEGGPPPSPAAAAPAARPAGCPWRGGAVRAEQQRPRRGTGGPGCLWEPAGCSRGLVFVLFCVVWLVGWHSFSFLPAPLPCGASSSLQIRFYLSGIPLLRRRALGSLLREGRGSHLQNNNNNSKGELREGNGFLSSLPRDHKPARLLWEQGGCWGLSHRAAGVGAVCGGDTDQQPPFPPSRRRLGKKSASSSVFPGAANRGPGRTTARRDGKGTKTGAGVARARRAPLAAVLTQAAPGLRVLLCARCPDPSICSWKDAARSYNSYEQLILH